MADSLLMDLYASCKTILDPDQKPVDLNLYCSRNLHNRDRLGKV